MRNTSPYLAAGCLEKRFLAKWIQAIVLLLMCMTIGSVTVWAQLGTQGTFEGTVKDSTGGVVPNATVTATNQATGIATTVMTNSDGLFRIPALPPGQYQVQSSQTGFGTEARNVELVVGATQEVDFTMQVGTTSSKVTVTEEAPLVDTTSATIGDVVNQQQVQNLPLNGREAVALTCAQRPRPPRKPLRIQRRANRRNQGIPRLRLRALGSGTIKAEVVRRRLMAEQN